MNIVEAFTRVVACGAVDDGKSTLIGRLLFDTGSLLPDELARMAKDIAGNATGSGPDLALATDALLAEREQGITIDVAFRHIRTGSTRILLADCPGHMQYTRNFASGASTADVALLVLDAAAGISAQTQAHADVCALMGVRSFIVAINKMDTVARAESRYAEIAMAVSDYLRACGVVDVRSVPTVAVNGENVVERSTRMPWYSGPTLVECLDHARSTALVAGPAMLLPVQMVNRTQEEGRGYAGTLGSGTIRVGQHVATFPGRQKARVTRILGPAGNVTSATGSTPVVVFLDDELDISRGSVIHDAAEPIVSTGLFRATLLWFSEHPLQPSRSYLLKIGHKLVACRIKTVLGSTMDQDEVDAPAQELCMNGVTECDIAVDEEIPFFAFAACPDLGRTIIIDRDTLETSGCAMHIEPRKTTDYVFRQMLALRGEDRRRQTGHAATCVWLTGLPGAGKSTLASLTELELNRAGFHTFVLDGDNLRLGLNRDLDFSPEARREAVRRTGEVAKLMVDAGLVVLVCSISPYRMERERMRALIGTERFIEVYVDTPLEVCEARDGKGLYQKARAGEIHEFTGISAPYEPPLAPQERTSSLPGSSAAQQAEVLASRIARALSDAGWPDAGDISVNREYANDIS